MLSDLIILCSDPGVCVCVQVFFLYQPICPFIHPFTCGSEPFLEYVTFLRVYVYANCALQGLLAALPPSGIQSIVAQV